MCLTDDKPICAICKLFGEHESHNVSKISEVYTERKNRFIEDIDWTFQQSEHAEQIRKVQYKKSAGGGGGLVHINKKNMHFDFDAGQSFYLLPTRNKEKYELCGLSLCKKSFN